MAVFDETIIRGKEFLLQRISPLDRPLPRDFSLGSLGQPGDGGPWEVGEKVLKAWENNEVPKDYLAERWKVFLTQLLRTNLDSYGPVKEYRLGNPQKDGMEEVLLPVLIKGSSWVSLRLYFVKKEDTWLLSDVQGDWSPLNKTANDEGLFDPENPPRK